MSSLPPGAILILGALLVPLLRGRMKQAFMLALPVVGGWQILHLYGEPAGVALSAEIFGVNLDLVRLDKLSLIFGLIFHVIALLNIVYSLHVRDNVQHVSGLIYAGAAIAAAFAGDLVTLFIYWELTAISSVFLIFASRTERAYRAGMRYLVVQVGSGVILLAGILFHFSESGSLTFDHLGTGTLGTNLILIAFGIKCAFPFLHNWLQDAYPEATVTGTVILSAFTTKLAIYALARGYAGTELLIPIGVTMTVFPIFYAVIENDLRRVLAYSLNNQLGFMVVGIGVGTAMSLNGTVAHAFAHLLYKALLFMSMGAVLYRTGTIRASELGGLYKSMPFTCTFCIIGALSISAFPLFSGFISKSLILTGAAEKHYIITSVMLLFASTGVLEHSGIKIPFFAFFARDSGIRCKEAPGNMLIAMAVTAVLCVGIGIFPQPLYDLLPHTVDFQPYTTGHVVTQLQILLFATLAFVVLMKTKLYPRETPSVNIDSDWVYRRMLPRMIVWVSRTGSAARAQVLGRVSGLLDSTIAGVRRHMGPGGVLARTWSSGASVLWVALLLTAFLLLYYAR